MRQAHLLLILLILAAIGSHAYVALNWDYRDAPDSVKYALGLGFLVTALLAILLGPRMLRGRGRGAIILPVLAFLVIQLGSVAYAGSLELPGPHNTGHYNVTMYVAVDPGIAEDELKLCMYEPGKYMAIHFSRGLNGHTNPRFGIATIDYTFSPYGLTRVIVPINHTLIKTPSLKWKLEYTIVVENNTLYINGYKTCTGNWTTTFTKPWILSVDITRIHTETSTPIEDKVKSGIDPRVLGLGMVLGLALVLVFTRLR